MAKKVLFSVLFGVAAMAMAGFATADFAVAEDVGMSIASPSVGSMADPELEHANSAAWQERGPLETGSMPAIQGNSPDLRCCSGDSGPSVDASGVTRLRGGIDDGP